MSSSPRIVVVIPIKPLASSKTRLEPVLSPLRRQALSLWLLHRVLSRVRGTRVPVEPWVVGGDATVEALSRREGAHPVEELGQDLNETVERAFQCAFGQGAGVAIYLPADLPFFETADLDALILASEEGQKPVLAPAQRGGGTNAILVPGSLDFRLQLGESSFSRHLEMAQASGWRWVLCQAPGFAFDLDTPEDLEQCQRRAPELSQDLQAWEAVLRSERDRGLAPTGRKERNHG